MLTLILERIDLYQALGKRCYLSGRRSSRDEM